MKSIWQKLVLIIQPPQPQTAYKMLNKPFLVKFVYYSLKFLYLNLFLLTEYLENAIKSFALLEKESGLSNEELRAAQERLDNMASEKKIRKKHNDELNNAWFHKEEDIFVSFVSSHGCFQKHCELCSKTLHNVIKCNHCKKHLCESCDLVIHLNSPFHQRNFYESELSCRKLLSHEFVDQQSGKLTTRGKKCILWV